MVRVLLRVKDKGNIEALKNYGTIIFTSPILNVVGLEIPNEQYALLGTDPNVLHVELEDEGVLLQTT